MGKNEEKEYIKRTIKSHKGKMNAAILLKWMIRGLSAGLVAALFILIIAFLTPFYYANLIAVILIAAGFTAGLTVGMLKRINDRKAALDIDSHGLHERVVTAFEAIDNWFNYSE